MSEFAIYTKQELLQKLASMKPGQEGYLLWLNGEQCLFTLNITVRTLDDFLEEIRSTYKTYPEDQSLDAEYWLLKDTPWRGVIFRKSSAD
jgi:quinolinate synthase